MKFTKRKAKLSYNMFDVLLLFLFIQERSRVAVDAPGGLTHPKTIFYDGNERDNSFYFLRFSFLSYITVTNEALFNLVSVPL